jgi:hypothetical protein
MSEYWIENDGTVEFADGDIGDYNHEGVVIERVQRSIIESCEQIFDVKTKYGRSFSDDEFIDWNAFCGALAEAYLNELIQKSPQRQEELEQKFDQNDDKFLMAALRQANVKRQEWDVANGSSDARDYAMQRWGWKTYRSQHIDTWFLRRSDIQAIVSGINEIAEQEGWREDSEYKKHFTLPFSPMENIFL